MKPTKLALAATLLATVPAMAQDRILTIYTYDSFVADWGPGPVIEAAFEESCDCDLQLVAAGDGAAVLARIKLEGARSEADLVLGLDTALTAEAAETGLFVEHGITPEGLTLPAEWTDANFLPYDWGHFAFVYDKEKLEVPPASFEELVAMPDDFKIIIQDPRSSTPGLGLLLWVKAAYGDSAAEIWRGLAPHVLTVTKGWSEAYGMFLEGEADMVLSYTTSPAYHRIAEEDQSKLAAIFDEGHYMQIEVAGILASSDQPELARSFLQFMLSEAFQSAIPTTNWMYPAALPVETLPEGFDQPLPAGQSLLLPIAEVPQAKRAALEEWLTELSR